MHILYRSILKAKAHCITQKRFIIIIEQQKKRHDTF